MNLVLAALPEAERQRLKPHLQIAQFGLREPMVEAGTPIRFVYFPIDLVASTVYSMKDGSTVETAIVGLEGIIGVQIFLGQPAACTHTFVQVPGKALRMRTEAFQKELHDYPRSVFSSLIACYLNAFLTLTTITAACNRIHRVEQRLSRWLKMTHNRAQSDTFPVRHEFLAYMLGVHRPSVSIAANLLKKAGLIRYDYGRMHIIDARGLEAGACECYMVMEKQIEIIYGKAFRK